jgi:hypothetical protein
MTGTSIPDAVDPARVRNMPHILFIVHILLIAP